MDSINANKDIKLKIILKALSSEKNLESKRDDYYERFLEIYSDDYRHNYSSVYTEVLLLTEEKVKNINCQEKGTREGTFEVLTFNLKKIALYSKENKENHELYLKIRKLYDHVSLEQARKSTYENLLDEYIMVKEDLESTKDFINKTKKKADKLREEVENSKKEYVSILGIFASIVLGFTGALSFTNSVFSNLTEVSSSKLFIAIASVGAVIIILLKMLLDLIYYSIGKAKEKRNEKRLMIIKGVTIGILISIVFSIIFKKKVFTVLLNI